MKDIAEKSLFVIPKNIKRLFWLFIILGIGMFIAGLFTGGDDSVLRTWQAFLINTVFWAGIAHAGIFFSVLSVINQVIGIAADLTDFRIGAVLGIR